MALDDSALLEKANLAGAQLDPNALTDEQLTTARNADRIRWSEPGDDETSGTGR